MSTHFNHHNYNLQQYHHTQNRLAQQRADQSARQNCDYIKSMQNHLKQVELYRQQRNPQKSHTYLPITSYQQTGPVDLSGTVGPFSKFMGLVYGTFGLFLLSSIKQQKKNNYSHRYPANNTARKAGAIFAIVGVLFLWFGFKCDDPHFSHPKPIDDMEPSTSYALDTKVCAWSLQLYQKIGKVCSFVLKRLQSISESKKDSADTFSPHNLMKKG